MKTIQVQPSCRPQQLPHTCCKAAAAASSLQSAQKHTQDCGTHTHTQLYPAATFLTVNQWVGLHLQQNDPSRCCFLSPRCLTPPPCCCPAVSLSVFVCASVSLLVCVCVCAGGGFTAVRARLRRLKRRRHSAASLPACWRYVTALSCRCQAPLPP